MLNATRFVLRLVTESAVYLFGYRNQSLCFDMRWRCPSRTKGLGSLSRGKNLPATDEPQRAKQAKERGITMAKSISTTTSKINNAQEEPVMKKITSNTTASEAMNAKEFKQASYDAYLVYVAFIEGKKSIVETVEALSPLMSAYGLTLTLENVANLLTVKMTNTGKDRGEQAKKVKSIATFRAFVKGGWKDVAAAPVHFSAGKNPADCKVSEKSKKPTKAELEAEKVALEEKNAALNAELAKLRAAAEQKAA